MLDGVHPMDEDHLAPMLAETAVMDRLLDDLRTLSLAEAGALPLYREPIDVRALADEVVAAHRPRADAARVTLTAAGDAALVTSVDPVRVREILGNLVGNALRHTPTGGHVTVDVRATEANAVLTVVDDGEGIAPDELGRVFDRFHRRADSGGSGLGLAIVRDLAAAHGGSVDVTSDGVAGRRIGVHGAAAAPRLRLAPVQARRATQRSATSAMPAMSSTSAATAGAWMGLASAAMAAGGGAAARIDGSGSGMVTAAPGEPDGAGVGARLARYSSLVGAGAFDDSGSTGAGDASAEAAGPPPIVSTPADGVSAAAAAPAAGASAGVFGAGLAGAALAAWRSGADSSVIASPVLVAGAAPAVPPEAKPPEATRTPTMPRAASPVPSGVANANRGPENAARKPRMPDGRSEAACSGVSRKSRGRTGAGSSGMAAAIARRSWWRAAHSVQPATRAEACSSAGPSASPAAWAATSSRSCVSWTLSGMWGMSLP